MQEAFRKIAAKTSTFTGTAYAFLAAVSIVVLWAITGPLFHFSSNWQLVINTGTTIVTFLMVFLIQNTQNRDSKAVHLKLDELIRATTARDAFVDLEDLSDAELSALEAEFKALHDKQVAGAVMTKLRADVAAEHSRRISLRTHAGNVMNMFNPLTTNKDDKDKNPPK